MIQKFLPLAIAFWAVGLCSCKLAAPGDHASIQASGDIGTNAPALRRADTEAIDELKLRLWEAIGAKSAEKFVDCYFIEERFDTPEAREANRKQVEILLRADIIDIELCEIPDKELVEIMKIQNAGPASAVRYSLVPRMMMWVRQRTEDGSVGRGFLIGVREGKWHIITFAGHTT